MDKWTEGELVSRQKKERKPIQWWSLLHLWAGICVKTYFDVSGLSKLILNAISDFHATSATSYARNAAVITMGALAIGYFLSRYLVREIDTSAMPNKRKVILKSVLPIAYFAGAVFLAMTTGPLFG